MPMYRYRYRGITTVLLSIDKFYCDVFRLMYKEPSSGVLDENVRLVPCPPDDGCLYMSRNMLQKNLQHKKKYSSFSTSVIQLMFRAGQPGFLQNSVPRWDIYIYIYKVKGNSRYRPGVAQRVGRGIALLFHDRGTRRG